MAGLIKLRKNWIQKNRIRAQTPKVNKGMEEDINEKNTGHRVTAKEIPPGSEILEESKDLSDQRKWPQIIFLIGLVVVIVMSFVQFPYYAYAPGSVNALTERVAISGTETFLPEGEILFTTVSQDSEVNGWEFLQGTFDESILLINENVILGERDRSEVRAFNLELMRSSKMTAVAVALQHLGYEPYLATGVGMIEVQGPAEGLLTTNDVITAIATDDTIDSTDWIELNTSEDLISKLQTYFPGDTVVFRVESVTGANQHQIPIVLGSRPDNPDAAFLGISVQTRIEDAPNMPFSVHFDTGAVGGNSAGLALTLSVLDLVTPGELTGGLRVATTGTISLNGDVGPIGGIVQKTITARRSGVDLFIVPTIEYQEAIKYAKGLNVVGVDTLDQALNALAEAGGNALNLSLSNN
tara:strand:- start:1774 stop:3006 length:1233 start_codon:yes stop_codon:yes gene_type:complete